MQFIKDLLNGFQGVDSSVVGLSGLKKKTEYVYIEVPKEFKKTFVTNVENNYLLI